MIVQYTALPGVAGVVPRPLLDVSVGGLDLVRVKCLADTGATNSLIPSWAAELAGVELSGVPQRSFGIGGTTTTARFATVALNTADLTWDAPVGFCDPWPFAWGLLGHDAFFRWFTVTFRDADLEFEVVPIEA